MWGELSRFVSVYFAAWMAAYASPDWSNIMIMDIGVGHVLRLLIP